MSRFAQPITQVSVSQADSSERWDAYVAGHPQASAYHAWAWKDVFEGAFGHETRYLVARSCSEIVGVLPLVLFRSRLFGRFVVSLPFVNYGGIVADSDEAADALLAAGIDEASQQRARFLELRHCDRRFPRLACRTHKVGMLLELRPTVDEQWKSFSKKVRNQIRKAERSGLVAKSGGVELLTDFYSVFARNMRDLGTPVYGRGFFETILSELPKATEVFGVYQGAKPVAAAVVVVGRDSVEVPWASSLRRFNTLCPNMLLYWTMLKQSIESSHRYFDFGRSTVGASTFKFKKQWGASPRPLVWEYWTSHGSSLPDFSPSSSRFELATAAWKRLPLPLASGMGPSIVRNIP